MRGPLTDIPQETTSLVIGKRSETLARTAAMKDFSALEPMSVLRLGADELEQQRAHPTA